MQGQYNAVETARVYAAIRLKHNILSGITVHCFYEDYVDYSIMSENLGHGTLSKFRMATYKELGEVLKKAGEELCK